MSRPVKMIAAKVREKIIWHCSGVEQITNEETIENFHRKHSLLVEFVNNLAHTVLDGQLEYTSVTMHKTILHTFITIYKGYLIRLITDIN